MKAVGSTFNTASSSQDIFSSIFFWQNLILPRGVTKVTPASIFGWTTLPVASPPTEAIRKLDPVYFSKLQAFNRTPWPDFPSCLK